jgi:hypothetical protein
MPLPVHRIFPDMRQEVARARELDQFASDHDAQLAFVLRARRAAWSPSYIVQMAAGWVLWPGPWPGAWWCRPVRPVCPRFEHGV